jgi:hypothetical protein
MVGRIVGRNGGAEYVAVDVRFPDGQYRLFWPGDLEEIASPQPWWRSLLGVQAEARDKTVLTFPKFDYYLDESDPDLVVLRRHDGAFVAAFSARGATREEIVEAAKEDYRELIQTHANSLAWESEEHRSA